MSINPAKKIEISSVRFSDVDHLSEWVTSVGWDINNTQISAGVNEICYDHFAFPDLLVSHYTMKQAMQAVFAIPDGMVLFLIVRAKLPLVWCGRQLPPTLLGVARSGRENWVVTPAGWDCYEFMVSEDLIHRTGIFPPDFFAKTTRLERAFLPLMEPITGQFLQQMDAFFQQGRGMNGSPGTAVRRGEFFDFTIHGLQQVVDAGLSAGGSHELKSTRRPELIKKAIDFMAADPGTDLSLDDMTQALGISYRVLNYAFRDTLGLSPYQYLLTEKLHAVRRQLKSSNVSVTEASLSHGFNTPSRFAYQYFRLFGELPSATKRLAQHRAA